MQTRKLTFILVKNYGKAGMYEPLLGWTLRHKALHERECNGLSLVGDIMVCPCGLHQKLELLKAEYLELRGEPVPVGALGYVKGGPNWPPPDLITLDVGPHGRPVLPTPEPDLNKVSLGRYRLTNLDKV
jgi:hypothetical protein